ncbi:hypothetical protein [Henriciella sp.]|uniref:hypothetical protein n=1 Tax=Henriciella sp. TaxID=1968823 RepID=UPI002627FAB7|nr:hypothetical protein [Henriciella sp.]
MDNEMQLLMARIAHLGAIGEAEARRIVNEIYNDGIVSREEAEAVFRLNDQLADRDPAWVERFIIAIGDFLLNKQPAPGWVGEEDADWLIGMIGREDNEVSDSELDLMLSVLRRAEGAPMRLSRFCLQAVSRRIMDEGAASEEMTERMRRILYAPAGEASLWVSRHEASVLFGTNDAIARAANAASWNNLFAKAVLNHLIAAAHPDPGSESDALNRQAWLKDKKTNVSGFLSSMAGSFTSGSWFDKVSRDHDAAMRAREMAKEAASRAGSQITQNEKNWFLRRLGWDKSVSPAERKLVDLLNTEVPGFAHGLLEATQPMKAA